MRAKRSGGGFVILAVIVWLASPSAAQTPQFRVVESPFQEDFAYAIGDDLEVGVEIQGVRWRLMRIAVRGDGELDPDRQVQVELTLEFENRSTDNARAQVIVLLEDADGGPLDRLSAEPIRISDGRFKEDIQRFRVSGASLQATTRVYLFCEVEF